MNIKNLISRWREARKLKKNGQIGKAEIIERKVENNFPKKEMNEDFFRRRSEQKIGVENKESATPKEAEIVPEEKIEEKKVQAEKKDLFEKILIERIAANPKDVEAYERLGEYYMEIENWNYAKECFKQVIKLNPRNRNVKNKMRQLEKTLGR